MIKRPVAFLASERTYSYYVVDADHELILSTEDATLEEITEIVACMNKVPALQAEIDALQQDAKRYRWLRECDTLSSTTVPCITVPEYDFGRYSGSHTQLVGRDADTAIDKAMS